MCCNPIKIKNPCRGWTSHDDPLYFTKDCVSEYIFVPCGRCHECTSLKQSYLTQRIQLEYTKHHMFFCTLTYNNDMLPYFDYDGRRYNYPDYHDLQNLIKMIRKYNVFGSRDFVYLACSEYGKRKHRPHFHVMFLVERKPADNRHHMETLADEYGTRILNLWRRNVNYVSSCTISGRRKVNTRNPIFKPLCNFVQKGKYKNFDFHYVDPDLTDNREADVVWYVTKYCTKTDQYINYHLASLKIAYKSKFDYLDANYRVLSRSVIKKLEDELQYIKDCYNLLKPRVCASKGIGADKDFIEHVRKGIDYALVHKLPNFVFFDLNTGKSFPLATYLRHKYCTHADLIQLYNNNYHNPDNVQDAPDEVDLDKRKRRSDKIRRFMNIQEYDEFDFLDF